MYDISVDGRVKRPNKSPGSCLTKISPVGHGKYVLQNRFSSSFMDENDDPSAFVGRDFYEGRSTKDTYGNTMSHQFFMGFIYCLN